MEPISRMPKRRIIHLLLLVLCLPMLFSVRANAQGTSTGRRRGSVKANRDQQFFGILGQVARPGVYELDRPFPSIVELVERAGGLANRASGSLRIIRNGRADQRLFYSPKQQFKLIPGDVVVVDSKEPSRSTSRLLVYSPDQNSGQTLVEPGGEVQLAFVNLIDRPIVLKTRRENATLHGIVSLLGQRAEIISTIRVITARGPRVNTTNNRSANATLTSGTTLIFDRSSIDASRIPTLSEPNRLNNSSAENVSPSEIAHPKPFISAPNVPVTEREPVEPQQKSDRNAASPIESTGPAFSNLVETLKAPEPNNSQSSAIEATGVIPESVVAVRPKSNSATQPTIAVVPIFSQKSTHSHIAMTNGHSENRSASSNESHSLHATPSTSQPNSLRNKKDKSFAPVDVLSSNQNLVVGDQSQQQSDRITTVVGIIGLAAIVFSGWLLLSMARQATSSEHESTQRTKKNRVKMLDAIINDELVLTEEAPQLPERLTLYGRPADQPKLRLDNGSNSSPQRPHFLNPSPQRVSSRQSLMTAEDEQTNTTGTPIYDTVVPPTEIENTDRSSRSARWQDMDSIAESEPQINAALGLLDRVLSDLQTESQR